MFDNFVLSRQIKTNYTANDIKVQYSYYANSISIIYSAMTRCMWTSGVPKSNSSLSGTGIRRSMIIDINSKPCRIQIRFILL